MDYNALICMSKDAKDLNNNDTTIQLQVEKMERDTARQAGKAKTNSDQRNRSSQFSPCLLYTSDAADE